MSLSQTLSRATAAALLAATVQIQSLEAADGPAQPAGTICADFHDELKASPQQTVDDCTAQVKAFMALPIIDPQDSEMNEWFEYAGKRTPAIRALTHILAISEKTGRADLLDLWKNLVTDLAAQNPWTGLEAVSMKDYFWHDRTDGTPQIEAARMAADTLGEIIARMSEGDTSNTRLLDQVVESAHHIGLFLEKADLQRMETMQDHIETALAQIHAVSPIEAHKASFTLIRNCMHESNQEGLEKFCKTDPLMQRYFGLYETYARKYLEADPAAEIGIVDLSPLHEISVKLRLEFLPHMAEKNAFNAAHDAQEGLSRSKDPAIRAQFWEQFQTYALQTLDTGSEQEIDALENRTENILHYRPDLTDAWFAFVETDIHSKSVESSLRLLRYVAGTMGKEHPDMAARALKSFDRIAHILVNPEGLENSHYVAFSRSIEDAVRILERSQAHWEDKPGELTEIYIKHMTVATDKIASVNPGRALIVVEETGFVTNDRVQEAFAVNYRRYLELLRKKMGYMATDYYEEAARRNMPNIKDEKAHFHETALQFLIADYTSLIEKVKPQSLRQMIERADSFQKRIANFNAAHGLLGEFITKAKARLAELEPKPVDAAPNP